MVVGALNKAEIRYAFMFLIFVSLLSIQPIMYSMCSAVSFLNREITTSLGKSLPPILTVELVPEITSAIMRIISLTISASAFMQSYSICSSMLYVNTSYKKVGWR